MKHSLNILLTIILVYSAEDKKIYAADLDDMTIMSAANTFINEVKSGTLAPPSWTDATVSNIQTIITSDGMNYVAKLINGDKQCGYVLLGAKNGKAIPLMYSGSCIPSKYINSFNTLSIDDANVPKSVTKIVDTKMVATFHVDNLNTNINSLSCSIASILMYYQKQYKYPLFEEYNFEYVLLPDENPLVSFKPPIQCILTTQAVNDNDWLIKKISEKRMIYQNKRDEIIASANLYEYKEITVLGNTKRVKIVKNGYRLFDLLSPVIMQNLLNPISASERYSMIKQERYQADNAVGSASEGIISSFIIQRGYLNKTSSVEAGIDLFMASRGFKIDIDRKKLEDLSESDLPCIVCSPKGDAGIIFGAIYLNQKNWIMMWIPDTVNTDRYPLWTDTNEYTKYKLRQRELLQKKLNARGIMLPDKKYIIPNANNDYTNKANDEGKHIANPEGKRVYCVDPCSTDDDALQKGAHMLYLGDHLSEWTILRLSNITTNNNWGYDDSRLRKEGVK